MILSLGRRFWPFFAIGLSTGLVFARVLGADFLSWQDTEYLHQNPWLQSGDIHHFWRSEYNGYYLPLTLTLWAFLWKMGASPMAFHALNLGLHTLNGCLVYLLARKVLHARKKDAVEHGEWGHQSFALIVALIFTLHPFQVETVAWVTGGRDLLAAFFGLLATLIVWDTGDRLFPTWAAWFRRLFATGIYVLGLLCKPSIALLPLALKGLSSFTERRGLKWKTMWLWLGLGAAAIGITMEIQASFVHKRVPALEFSDRLIVAADAVFFYLKKFFIAAPLSADYGRTPTVVLHGPTMIPWLPYLLLGVILLGVGARFLPRAVWGGLLFFLLMLAPVLGLTSFAAQSRSTVADHYMYLPVIGLGLIFASLISESTTRIHMRLLLALGVVSFFGGQSWARVDVWKNDQTLLQDILRKNPWSYDALIEMGRLELKAGDIILARKYFESAKEINPHIAVAQAELMNVYYLQKELAFIRILGRNLSETAFIDFNRVEPKALSLMWQVLGRVQADQKESAQARASYCNSLSQYPFNDGLKIEVEEFFKSNPEQIACLYKK